MSDLNLFCVRFSANAKTLLTRYLTLSRVIHIFLWNTKLFLCAEIFSGNVGAYGPTYGEIRNCSPLESGNKSLSVYVYSAYHKLPKSANVCKANYDFSNFCHAMPA